MNVPKEPALGETARHPHDAVIRAWLDGQNVQYFDRISGEWTTMAKVKNSNGCFFSGDTRYRIKPKTKTITHTYRRYIYNAASGRTLVGNYRYGDSNPADVKSFIKWIDNGWVTETYEVEVES